MFLKCFTKETLETIKLTTFHFDVLTGDVDASTGVFNVASNDAKTFFLLGLSNTLRQIL
jgi:hypothetical protein